MGEDFKYFTDSIQYPHIGKEILPYGVQYEYIASSFLNGMVNYYTPIKAYLINRYEDWNSPLGIYGIEPVSDATASNINLGQSETVEIAVSSRVPQEKVKGILVNTDNDSWPIYQFKTKQDIYDTLILPEAMCHTDLSNFQDDVLMLSMTTDDDSDKEYCFFWYDRDVSDCFIGRFITDDSTEEVIKEFDRWVNSMEHYQPIKEIPTSVISGWISG